MLILLFCFVLLSLFFFVFYFFISSSPRVSVCCFFPLFFSSRGARGHAVVMANDPFTNLVGFFVAKNPYFLR